MGHMTAAAQRCLGSGCGRKEGGGQSSALAWPRGQPAGGDTDASHTSGSWELEPSTEGWGARVSAWGEGGNVHPSFVLEGSEEDRSRFPPS